MNNKKNIFFYYSCLMNLQHDARTEIERFEVSRKKYSVYAMITLSFARSHRSSAGPVVNLVPSRHQLSLLLLTITPLFSTRISLSSTAKSMTSISTHYSSLRWNRISRDFPFSCRRCIIPQRRRPSPHSFWLLQD